MKTRTHPAQVRAAIAAATVSVSHAARVSGFSGRQITRWVTAHEASGGVWPDPAHDAAWEAEQAVMAAVRARKAASARRCRARRLRGLPSPMVDATGTRRRIQGLLALGWSLQQLGDRVGVTGACVCHWTVRPRVTQVTAVRVRRLYDDLSMTVPAGWMAERARRQAKRKGWPVPLTWDDDSIDDPTATSDAGSTSSGVVDESAVLRRMAGDRVRLTKAEAAEVVHRMLTAGVTWGEIERVSGLNPSRYRGAA